MNIVLIEERTSEQIAELVSIWRASVEAPHHFLTPEDIDRIAGYVPDAIGQVESLVIAQDDNGMTLGFAGVQGDVLEMLFLAPEQRGNGVGRKLLTYAEEQLGARKLEVNEENPQARGFYEHCGWQVVGRRETDDAGEPYPLLEMELVRS